MEVIGSYRDTCVVAFRKAGIARKGDLMVGDSAGTSKSQIVCVLGMHRSGTSLVTRILNLLGVDLGPEEHLMKPKVDNPKGFWEHRLFTELNDEIFARLGGSWHEPPTFSQGWQNAPGFADLRQRARKVIHDHFNPAQIWGWKDPRTCLTLPFWQNLLSPITYVLCLRNPIDVAQSLHHRDAFPFEKSIRLWLAHVSAALEHTAGQPRIVLFYEDLILDWRTELTRLAQFMGMAEAAGEEDIQARVGEFIDEELQHHRNGILETVDDCRVLFPAKALYIVLRLYVGFDSAVPAERVLDVFSRYAVGAKKEFDSLLEENADRLKQLAGERERFAKSLREKELQIAELTANRDRIDRELELQGHSLQARDIELARIYASHGWKALLAYYRMRNKVFPANTRRKLVAKFVFNSLVNPRQFSRNLTFRRLSKLGRLLLAAPPDVADQEMTNWLSLNSCSQEPGDLLEGHVGGQLSTDATGEVHGKDRFAAAAVAPELVEAIKTFLRMILPEEEAHITPLLPELYAMGRGGKVNFDGLEECLDRLLRRRVEPTRPCWHVGQGEHRPLRILMVTGMFPSVMHGGGLRLFDIISELSERHQIDLYSGYRDDIDSRSLEVLRPKLGACRAVSYSMFTVKDVVGWLGRRGIRPRFYDVIQFEYSTSSALILSLKLYGRLAAFTLMESLARSRALGFVRDVTSDPARAAESLYELIQSAEAEKRAVELCDIGIAVTDADADFVARLGVSRPYVVPTCISKRLIGVSNEENGENESNSAVFVGYYHHRPNKEGLTWYLEEVHAKVRARIPGYKLYVVGAGPLQDLKVRFGSDPSLVFVGQVEEILPAIRRARLGIAPLVSGAGIRGKINQYAAAGRPTVCTSLAASGMAYSDGESIIVRDTAEGFAQGIVQLLSDEDLWKRIRSGAIRVLESHYSWDVQIPRLEGIYHGRV